jgi:hypothetical protein
VKPTKVKTLPEAANTAVPWSSVSAEIRTLVRRPVAFFIWEARVRFQISSYRRYSSSPRAPLTLWGVRNASPAGRIASWAS